MRRPVLLDVVRTVVRAVLLTLLPAFALPLVAWSSPATPADLTAADLAPSSVVSAPPAGESAGDGLVLPGHASARQAPTERVTGAAPPPPDGAPVERGVVAPPRPAAAPRHGPGPDAAPASTSHHEPTLGRAPPSVTRT